MMRVAELVAELLKLPADMPVVMCQDNEPLGAYSVADVERRLMRRDNFWTDPEEWEVWDYANPHRPDGHDVEVAYLGFNEPHTDVVEAPSAAVATPAVEEHEPVSMAAVLARLDAVTAMGRCFVCDEPGALLCDECQAIAKAAPV